VTHSYLLHK